MFKGIFFKTNVGQIFGAKSEIIWYLVLLFYGYIFGDRIVLKILHPNKGHFVIFVVLFNGVFLDPCIKFLVQKSKRGSFCSQRCTDLVTGWCNQTFCILYLTICVIFPFLFCFFNLDFFCPLWFNSTQRCTDLVTGWCKQTFSSSFMFHTLCNFSFF